MLYSSSLVGMDAGLVSLLFQSIFYILKYYFCTSAIVQLQKQVNLIQLLKKSAAPKKAIVKKDMKSKVMAKEWL